MIERHADRQAAITPGAETSSTSCARWARRRVAWACACHLPQFGAAGQL